LVAALAISLVLAGDPAGAQPYPNRPIKLVLPFVAGTPNDVVARVVAQPLAAALKQPIVIDNRPGGATLIGTRAVAQSDPDGYTLLVTAPNHVIAPAQASTRTYDPIKDFEPVATIATAPWVLVASPNVRANSVQELVKYAHANPGKLTIGFGKGTSPELVTELFKLETKSNIRSIPYRGGAQVLQDILAGVIDLNFSNVGVTRSLIAAGKLKALAVTSDQRIAELPNVPTLAESGVAGLSSLSFWTGMLAPAQTPSAIVNRLNAEINAVLQSAEVKSGLAKLSFAPKVGTPQEFAAFLAAERPRWEAIVKATGVTAE
jgi:tripartite-type tricarboxylate transporter receptor subunit TctC